MQDDGYADGVDAWGEILDYDPSDITPYNASKDADFGNGSSTLDNQTLTSAFGDYESETSTQQASTNSSDLDLENIVSAIQNIIQNGSSNDNALDANSSFPLAQESGDTTYSITSIMGNIISNSDLSDLNASTAADSFANESRNDPDATQSASYTGTAPSDAADWNASAAANDSEGSDGGGGAEAENSTAAAPDATQPDITQVFYPPGSTADTTAADTTAAADATQWFFPPGTTETTPPPPETTPPPLFPPDTPAEESTAAPAIGGDASPPTAENTTPAAGGGAGPGDWPGADGTTPPPPPPDQGEEGGEAAHNVTVKAQVRRDAGRGPG